MSRETRAAVSALKSSGGDLDGARRMAEGRTWIYNARALEPGTDPVLAAWYRRRGRRWNGAANLLAFKMDGDDKTN